MPSCSHRSGCPRGMSRSSPRPEAGRPGCVPCFSLFVVGGVLSGCSGGGWSPEPDRRLSRVGHSFAAAAAAVARPRPTARLRRSVPRCCPRMDGARWCAHPHVPPSPFCPCRARRIAALTQSSSSTSPASSLARPTAASTTRRWAPDRLGDSRTTCPGHPVHRRDHRPVLAVHGGVSPVPDARLDDVRVERQAPARRRSTPRSPPARLEDQRRRLRGWCPRLSAWNHALLERLVASMTLVAAPPWTTQPKSTRARPGRRHRHDPDTVVADGRTLAVTDGARRSDDAHERRRAGVPGRLSRRVL